MTEKEFQKAIVWRTETDAVHFCHQVTGEFVMGHSVRVSDCTGEMQTADLLARGREMVSQALVRAIYEDRSRAMAEALLALKKGMAGSSAGWEALPQMEKQFEELLKMARAMPPPWALKELR